MAWPIHGYDLESDLIALQVRSVVSNMFKHKDRTHVWNQRLRQARTTQAKMYVWDKTNVDNGHKTHKESLSLHLKHEAESIPKPEVTALVWWALKTIVDFF